MKSPLRGIYGITDDALLNTDTMLLAVEAALLGDIKLLQYRCKTPALPDKKAQAQSLLALCENYPVPLVINDDMQLCAEIRANDVHLGQDDGDCAADAGADYAASGRFFPSKTKPDASAAQLEILSLAREKIDIPIVAIGGINPENGAPLIAAGADMLAVINGLFGAADDIGHKGQDQEQDFNKLVLARARKLVRCFLILTWTLIQTLTLILNSRAIQSANPNPRKLYETRSIPGAL